MNRYLEKVAMLIQQYQHNDTGNTKWITEKQKGLGKKWHPTGKKKYVKRTHLLNVQ